MFTVIAKRKDSYDTYQEVIYLGIFSTRELAEERIKTHCKELRLLTIPFIHFIFTSELDTPVVMYER